MSARIAPLQPEDRAAWEVLARGYKDFYYTPTTDAEYGVAWNRLLAQDGVHGLAAWLDGRMSASRTTCSTPRCGPRPTATCKTCSRCTRRAARAWRAR